MLFDRDPVLRILADKYDSRSFIASRTDKKYLVPILWHGTDPEQIPFASLPPAYVIKATHGSGFNLFVSAKSGIGRDAVKNTVRSWLAQDYCLSNCVGSEWAYYKPSPKIVIEPDFSDPQGCPPPDYKIYCFNGNPRLVQIDFNRTTEHTRSMHDISFRQLDIRFTYQPTIAKVEKPAHFDMMIELAETLSRGFKLLRVDFYQIKDEVFVGELTNYPGGGRMLIRPREFDKELTDYMR